MNGKSRISLPKRPYIKTFRGFGDKTMTGRPNKFNFETHKIGLIINKIYWKYFQEKNIDIAVYINELLKEDFIKKDILDIIEPSHKSTIPVNASGISNKEIHKAWIEGRMGVRRAPLRNDDKVNFGKATKKYEEKEKGGVQ